MIPDFLKHNFVFDLDLTQTTPETEAQIYRCSHCRAWVADLDKYSQQICPKRDRRKSGIENRRKTITSTAEQQRKAGLRTQPKPGEPGYAESNATLSQ
jgi:hypothetical protein